MRAVGVQVQEVLSSVLTDTQITDTTSAASSRRPHTFLHLTKSCRGRGGGEGGGGGTRMLAHVAFTHLHCCESEGNAAADTLLHDGYFLGTML